MGLRNDIVKKLPLFVVPILILTCCAPQEGAYPSQAKAILAENFRWDGRIHSLSRGNFDINPTTIFCTYRPGYGLDAQLLSDALKSLDRSEYLNGAPRLNGSFGPQRPSHGCARSNANDPIFIRGEKTTYRTSYRIAIVVWQRDALWVGVVERLDGLRRDAVAGSLPVNDGPSFYTLADYEKIALRENSERLDGSDLTRAFLRRVKRPQ